MTFFRSFLPRRFVSAVSLFLLALCPVTAVTGAYAQTQATESELKAAIIVNMLLFVEWPVLSGRPADQFLVCHLGSSPVADALSRIDGKRIRSRVVKVTKVSPELMAGCHVVYLSPANRADLPALFDTLRAASVLLVSDSPDYFQRGVMLNLDLTAERIVFDVDLRSAHKAGLQISSKALRLARQVID